eukprot:TRINITY_DN4156_c0_g2_i1.p1 TRINITY_DN4156_c0_g2~~TRINITY_DN4156_c0_g2_i1.p1  ORF type:complete len:340 (-),score=45.45 TRINITY_DN4156_c0_g2_i1:169-1074(-)
MGKNGGVRGGPGAILLCLLLVFWFQGNSMGLSMRPTVPRIYTYSVIKEFYHDPSAFTQGLLHEMVWDKNTSSYKDILLESTGLYGESTVREVDLESGLVVRKVDLDQRWFGEGLVNIKGKLHQLTWLTPTSIIYDRESFEKLGEQSTGLKDGWGATTDGRSLIVSDSTNFIYWYDPETYTLERKLDVRDDDIPVKWINELEYIEGEIWANIWQRDCIARIDPKSGRVNGWILLQGLKSDLRKRRIPQKSQMDVLNGIAYDKKQKRLFVTGKLWPRLFEIQVEPVHRKKHELQSIRRQCIVR